MVKKTSQIVDEIAVTWLSERWLKLIAETQRDIAELLSDFDPMWTGNVFAELREAIVDKEPEKVDMILIDKIGQFNSRMSDACKKMLDLRAVIMSVPEAYGGNGAEDIE